MANTVIQSRGLGKKFIINHAAAPREGELFVDLLVNRARSLGRRMIGRPVQHDPGRARIEEFWALQNVSFSLRHGEALALNPDYPDAHFYLAVTLEKLGLSQQEMARYFRVSPGSIAFWENRMRFHYL